ncbi:hypothetical protein [Sphingosinithalassobacter sp. LHW66-3]|uniref:hypothetical protein n=1 Tax=Sphingosinithalassobacter sp. LHW66-3 TaxID=3424718 RepID=UPI003D6A848D
MAFKKIAASAAAMALMVSAGVAQATASANALTARASTASEESNEQFAEATPLFVIGGIVAVVAILEVTEAINIFGDDDPDSP